MQHQRLKTIKQALIERLDQFPANGGGFENPDPNADPNPSIPSNMVVEEGEHASSSAEDVDLTLWHRGATDEDNSQSETRPGQDGPGGWELCRNTFIFLEYDILCVVAFLSGYIFRGIF